jgi:hypothetical protein
VCVSYQLIDLKIFYNGEYIFLPLADYKVVVKGLEITFYPPSPDFIEIGSQKAFYDTLDDQQHDNDICDKCDTYHNVTPLNQKYLFFCKYATWGMTWMLHRVTLCDTITPLCHRTCSNSLDLLMTAKGTVGAPTCEL